MGEHMSPAQARELAEELRNYREILGVPAYEPPPSSEQASPWCGCGWIASGW